MRGSNSSSPPRAVCRQQSPQSPRSPRGPWLPASSRHVIAVSSCNPPFPGRAHMKKLRFCYDNTISTYKTSMKEQITPNPEHGRNPSNRPARHAPALPASTVTTAPVSRHAQTCGHLWTLPGLIVIQGWQQKFILSAEKIACSALSGSPPSGDPGHDPSTTFRSPEQANPCHRKCLQSVCRQPVDTCGHSRG